MAKKASSEVSSEDVTANSSRDAQVALIYGELTPRQDGETSQEYQIRKTTYEDEVAHFVGIFPDQSPFQADCKNGIAHCKQYDMGEPVFYCSIEGTPGSADAKKVVSVSWPLTDIKYRTRNYDTLKLAAGNIVANYQEWVIDAGGYVEPEHPFLNDAYREKNQANKPDTASAIDDQLKGM